MERKVIITTDSTVDLTPELAEKYQLHIIPLGVEMDGQMYHDGVDVKADDLYDYYACTGKLAHTSAASMGEYEDVFRSFTDQGYEVVHVALADYLSCTQQNARMVAEEMEGVYVVNSKRLSTGIALLAIHGSELADEGLSGKEIADILNEEAWRVDVSFVLDTLEYMHAGGRCSGVAKFGANLLKIKPQIVVYDDKMDSGKKYRGKLNGCRLQYIEEQLHDPDDICLDRIFFTHSGMSQEDIDLCVAKIKEVAHFEEVIVTRAGCVISCHCGPGCCGVLFVRKSRVFDK